MTQEEYDSAVAVMKLMLEGKPWVKTYAGGQPNYTVRETHTNIGQWVGLTDDEFDALAIDENGLQRSHLEFVWAFEEKLREKNSG